jgi:hypothetical protein
MHTRDPGDLSAFSDGGTCSVRNMTRGPGDRYRRTHNPVRPCTTGCAITTLRPLD